MNLVKWYKGGREIYRYLPSNPSPVTIYPRHGVKIDQVININQSSELLYCLIPSDGLIHIFCEPSGIKLLIPLKGLIHIIFLTNYPPPLFENQFFLKKLVLFARTLKKIARTYKLAFWCSIFHLFPNSYNIIPPSSRGKRLSLILKIIHQIIKFLFRLV